MTPKKRWSELTRSQQVTLVVVAVAEVVLTSLALADLARRPNALVRGPKAVWRMVCLVQPVGPLSYLLVGRRRAGS